MGIAGFPEINAVSENLNIYTKLLFTYTYEDQIYTCHTVIEPFALAGECSVQIIR